MPTPNTMKNIYTLISRDASTDANDKMNTITKIIEKFTFTIPEEDLKTHLDRNPGTVPLFPAHYVLATSWLLGEKLTAERSMRVAFHIMTSKGKDLGGPVQELTVPKGTDRLNVNIVVDGMPAEESGIYTLEARLEEGDKVLATGEFPVEIMVELQ